MNEEDVEPYMADLAEKDKTEERFRIVSEDEKCSKKEDAWQVKIVGDNQPYTKGEGTVNYSILLIKSNRWPGSITMSKGGKFMSLYVGDGIKKGASFFNPTEPPMVEMDPSNEPKEEPEPNGKEYVAPVEKNEDEEDEDN